MEWAKAFYGAFGAPHPVASQIIVPILAALLFGGVFGIAWFVLAQQYDKDQPRSVTEALGNFAQPPAFDLSDRARATVADTNIFGVPHGLARMSGDSNLFINGSTIVGDPDALPKFLPPSAGYVNLTNAQLRSMVEDISKQLIDFQKDYEPITSSPHTTAAFNAIDLGKIKTDDFRHQFAIPLYELASALIARTGASRSTERTLEGVQVRVGWDIALTGKLAGSPSDAVVFLKWLVAKLPD